MNHEQKQATVKALTSLFLDLNNPPDQVRVFSRFACYRIPQAALRMRWDSSLHGVVHDFVYSQLCHCITTEEELADFLRSASEYVKR